MRAWDNWLRTTCCLFAAMTGAIILCGVIGCPPPPPPPPPPPSCETNADCADLDDGMFCTGEPTCLENGNCELSGDPCTEDQVCVETSDRCAERCDSAAECDDTLFCNGPEGCVENVCLEGAPPCAPDETCDEENDECVPEGPMASYVGSERCADCHPATFDSFMLTGHPFKLNEVVDGDPPTFPVTTLAGPPPGLEWTDTTFVIGGFRWKYRVIDQDGFVVLGPTAQYNYPSQVFAPYNNDENHTAPDGTPGPWDTNIGRKDYACGPCHMTAYDLDTPNRRGLPGLIGDWEFDGIQCEECHGPGSEHVASLSADDIDGDPDTDTVCGKCHTRSAAGIAASGGFIRHHEQWDEFSRTAHASVMANGCMTCHDTHQPIFDDERLAAIQEAAADPENRSAIMAVDNLDPPPGIIAECTDCHSVEVNHVVPLECISCHMAYTGKSAQSINANMGDIRAHVWKINAAADAMMFTDADGNPVARDSGNTAFAALDDEGEPFITLDFACLRCHTERDIDWAAAIAGSIHP